MWSIKGMKFSKNRFHHLKKNNFKNFEFIYKKLFMDVVDNKLTTKENSISYSHLSKSEFMLKFTRLHTSMQGSFCYLLDN